jgi:lysozyme
MSIFDRFFKKSTPAAPMAPIIPIIKEAVIAEPEAPPASPVAPVVAPVAPPAASSALATSQAGIELIKQFEGCELHAYPDPGTGGDPWTIGYGHTGPDTKKGRTVTLQEAEDLLKQDLRKFEQGVSQLLTVSVTQPQFDALVSFAYNCGLQNLKTSTLLRLCNQGDKAAAAEQFARWNKAAGKVMAGLTRRREAEKALFLS